MRQFTILREAVINHLHAYIIDSSNMSKSDLSYFINEKQIGIIIYHSKENIFELNQQFGGMRIDLNGIQDQDTIQQLCFSTNSIRQYIISSREFQNDSSNFTNILFLLRNLDENYLQLFALYVDQMNMSGTEPITKISKEYQRLLEQWDNVEEKLNKFIQKRSASTNPNTTKELQQSLVIDFPDILNQSKSPFTNFQSSPREQIDKSQIEFFFKLPPHIVIPQFKRNSQK